MSQLTVRRSEYRPLVSMLNLGAACAERLGFGIGDIDQQGILAAARRATGLTDWGDERFLEPMQRVVSAIAGADLSPLGRVLTRAAFIRAVQNRLWLQKYVKEHPEVLDIPVERPIFVLGFPRTGTTVLQNLLSLDPNRRALEFWELTTPVPKKRDPVADKRRRMTIVNRQLRAAYLVAPEMGEIHEIRADSAEECWPLFYNSFACLNMDMQSGLDEYGSWLMDYDMVWPYQEYKVWLQVMLHTRGARHLVLKCPEHLWFLDALLEVFPDACIVWTHRDPADSVASYCSLISLARRMLWGRVDLHDLGRDITERFHTGVERAMRAREHHDEARFFDVSFADLVRDQAAMVGNITDYFDLDPPDVGSVQAWLDAKRADGRGKHKYDADRYGLDPAAIRARFGEYIDRFEVKTRAA